MERKTMMEMMREAISNVLETMFFQPVQISDRTCTLQEWLFDKQSLLGATLNFNGPSAGSCYILIPIKVVTVITANFLGLEEKGINEEQRRDTVKEAINMIGGDMFSLFDKEGAFKLGIPELIEENDFNDNKLGDLRGDIILIETEDNCLAAGIEIET
jgi:CheY-specific phosphatase CheX